MKVYHKRDEGNFALSNLYYIKPISIRYIQHAYSKPSKNSISDTISHYVPASMRIKNLPELY